MSRFRDELPRDRADELLLANTIPIRRDSKPVANDCTAPLPIGAGAAHSGINRITPHFRTSGGESYVPAIASLFHRGHKIGDYEILEELARGGMGVVYKAQQISLKRTVALKMVLSGKFARLEDLLRFQSEAQAIARLHHPNLVSIFEIGEHDGLPFYAMEFLEGGSLANRLNRLPLAPRVAAQLMLSLAGAIDFAHSRGVIHRDLKPANVLISDASLPLEHCIAKITDFGIAKQLGVGDNLTRTGEILGTPSYMAPEQATGHGHDVGPAADVYSLGAILYETLTGQSPFHGSDGADTILRVLHTEPTPPRKINPHAPADLETICLKCLEKNPAKRYPTAGLLADDLRRFLGDEPILARPATPLERGRKWVRRSPVAATMLGAGALLALVGLASIVMLWQQAEAKATVEAAMLKAKETNLVEVKTLLADALLERGIALSEKNDIRRGLHWMIRSLEVAEPIRDRDERAGAIADAVRYNLAHWGEHVAPPEMLLPHNDWAWSVGFSPDGRHAVTGSTDRHVRVWDTLTGKIVGEPLAHDHPVWSVEYHHSGKFLFAAGGNQRGELRAYQSVADKSGQFELKGSPITLPSGVRKLFLAPGGKFVLAILRGGFFVYSFDPSAEYPLVPYFAHTGIGVVHAEFSADGKRLYVAAPGEVHTLDIERKQFVQPAWRVGNSISTMVLSPDRLTLAVCLHEQPANQAVIHFWDLKTGRKALRKFECRGEVKTLAFAPDGRRIAMSVVLREGTEVSGQVRVADIDDGDKVREYFSPIVHRLPVFSLAFHPSGQLLITGCQDGHSRLWEVATGKLIAPPAVHEGTVANLAISPDGRQFLSASAGGNSSAHARLQGIPALGNLPRLFEHNKPLLGAQWLADNRHIVAKDSDGQIARWDTLVLKKVEAYSFPISPALIDLRHPRYVTAFDPKRGKMTPFEIQTGKQFPEFPDFALDWKDAHIIPFAGLMPMFDRKTSRLSLFRIEDGVRHGESIPLPAVPYNFFCNEKSGLFGAIVDIRTEVGPEQAIVTGSEVRIWDTSLTLRQSWKFTNRIHAVSFNATGELISTYGDYQVLLFNVQSGERFGRGISYDQKIHSWFFHPTEDVFGFGMPDGSVLLWHTKSSKPIGKAINIGSKANFLTPCPDGSGYLGASRDHRPVFWKHLGPRAGSPTELKTWVENLTGMTLDANDELTPIDPIELHGRRAKRGG